MNLGIIQARLNSTRLPGKALLPLAGKPMLLHVVERVRRIRGLDAVVVATTQDDAAIAAACDTWGVDCYQWPGPVNDVLGRFVATGKRYHDVEYVLRVCGDSPMLDVIAAEELLAHTVERQSDYASYRIGGVASPQLPNGYFAEVVRYDALVRLDRSLAASDPRREHVTLALYDWTTCRHRTIPDGPAWWATDPMPLAAVDTPDDYQRVKAYMEAGYAD